MGVAPPESDDRRVLCKPICDPGGGSSSSPARADACGRAAIDGHHLHGSSYPSKSQLERAIIRFRQRRGAVVREGR